MTQTGEQAPRTPLLKPPPRRPSPYERFVRIGIMAWCGIGVIILGYLMLRLVVYVNPVVPPLLIAVAVVYLLNPLVSALERRGRHRLRAVPLHCGPGRLAARSTRDQAGLVGDRSFPRLPGRRPGPGPRRRRPLRPGAQFQAGRR